MYTVLLADDESIIRRGLKKLVNWESLGFCIAGETGDGLSTLDFILKNNPQLVLLDIKMPEIDGLEVMKRARAAGFKGKVIILSGYSDFSYAQEAFHYDVKYYLCKPVESDLLRQELLSVAKQLDSEISSMLTADTYKKKATDTILKEILFGDCDFSQLNLRDIHLDGNHFQIAIYERYHPEEKESYSFSELLRVANKDQNFFFTVVLEGREVILLKNEYAISKFKDFLEHYDRNLKPQDGSPLDSLFITYGREVKSPADISCSYNEANQLLQRRFFCAQGQHTLGYKALSEVSSSGFLLDENALNHYADLFTNYLQAANRNELRPAMQELTENLRKAPEDIDSIKLFLTDLLLRIKEKLSQITTAESIFPTNSQLINTIREKSFLYEITDFFLAQFDSILKSNCFYGKGSTIDNVVYFIQNNYKENLRLESIATAFGYNTSYLGHIFNEKMGCSFNTYLDKIRIEKACALLENQSLRVYDIAGMVGYKNVDYFHLKFKKLMNQSPIEYRKSKI